MKVNNYLIALLIALFSCFALSDAMDEAPAAPTKVFSVSKAGQEFKVFQEDKYIFILEAATNIISASIAHETNTIKEIFINPFYEHMAWDEYLIMKTMNILKDNGHTSIYYKGNHIQTMKYLAKCGFKEIESDANNQQEIIFDFNIHGSPIQNIMEYYKKETNSTQNNK